MEKFIRVSDMNKDHAPVYTAEEIADNARGVASWMWNGEMFICTNCGSGSRDDKRFCKYCGSRNR